MPYAPYGQKITMDQPGTEKKGEKPRILVAPLDWGLGHAARCIPLIQTLVDRNCEVWLAGEGAQQHLLQEAFPELPFLQLPGYRIRYAKTAGGLAWKMIRQYPRLLRAIRKEREWLQEKMSTHAFDAVISDNRYGLCHPDATCVFITHQLLIKSWLGRWTESLMQKKNYRYISLFSACWVPDEESQANLAGELSHPGKKPQVPVKYIGWLSRCKKLDLPEKKGHILVVLSGPEPQRSLLEEKVIQGISHYAGTATVARGLPGSAGLIPSTNMIRFVNHLPARELNEEMQQAEWVISRSGYSTIMDLVSVGKRSVLVPTPGQTEQEYLAVYLAGKGIAATLSQKDFTLEAALDKARTCNYTLPEAADNSLLKKGVEELLQSIAQKKQAAQTNLG